MDTYEINKYTLAILPTADNEAIVFEKDNKYVINESVDKIMEDSCLYFGSNLKGRQLGSSSLLKLTHKVPIVIEESANIIFFPTTSPRLAKCSWISLNNIESYERNEKGTKINFIDGQSVIIPISYGMINNQILRSSRLQYLLNNRRKEK